MFNADNRSRPAIGTPCRSPVNSTCGGRPGEKIRSLTFAPAASMRVSTLWNDCMFLARAGLTEFPSAAGVMAGTGDLSEVEGIWFMSLELGGSAPAVDAGTFLGFIEWTLIVRDLSIKMFDFNQCGQFAERLHSLIRTRSDL